MLTRGWFEDSEDEFSQNEDYMDLTLDTENERDPPNDDIIRRIGIDSFLEQVRSMPTDLASRIECQKYLDDVSDVARFLRRVIWRNTKVYRLGPLRKLSLVKENQTPEPTKTPGTTQSSQT